MDDDGLGGSHHRIVCRVCGLARDADYVAGELPCLEPGAAGRFTVEQAEITFWGICPECPRSSKEEGTT